jgi:Holliday junction resolvasome RuvABC endonuclease subunit
VILGVDPGLAHCGWALVNGGELVERGMIATAAEVVGHQERGGKRRAVKAAGDNQRRVADVCRALHGKMRRADMVVVEWPGGGFGRNAHSAATTAAVAGAIAGMAWGIGRKVNAPASLTWRSHFGHKRGKDEQLHGELTARYHEQLTGLSQDELPHVLDAIGLALYGEACTNPRAGAQLALVS